MRRAHFEQWATIFQPPDEEELLLFDEPSPNNAEHGWSDHEGDVHLAWTPPGPEGRAILGVSLSPRGRKFLLATYPIGALVKPEFRSRPSEHPGLGPPRDRVGGPFGPFTRAVTSMCTGLLTNALADIWTGTCSERRLPGRAIVTDVTMYVVPEAVLVPTAKEAEASCGKAIRRGSGPGVHSRDRH